MSFGDSMIDNALPGEGYQPLTAEEIKTSDIRIDVVFSRLKDIGIELTRDEKKKVRQAIKDGKLDTDQFLDKTQLTADELGGGARQAKQLSKSTAKMEGLVGICDSAFGWRGGFTKNMNRYAGGYGTGYEDKLTEQQHSENINEMTQSAQEVLSLVNRNLTEEEKDACVVAYNTQKEQLVNGSKAARVAVGIGAAGFEALNTATLGAAKTILRPAEEIYDFQTKGAGKYFAGKFFGEGSDKGVVGGVFEGIFGKLFEMLAFFGSLLVEIGGRDLSPETAANAREFFGRRGMLSDGTEAGKLGPSDAAKNPTSGESQSAVQVATATPQDRAKAQSNARGEEAQNYLDPTATLAAVSNGSRQAQKVLG